jgi:mono/diheme cytochrome c family protein
MLFCCLAASAALPLNAAGTFSGRQLFLENCAACHGVNGDGAGSSASRLSGPAPRDFREAAFHFRSTPSGELPVKEDLERTIRQGVALSAMPAFGNLFSQSQQDALVGEIELFSPRWKTEGPGAPALLPEPGTIPVNTVTLEKGKALFILLRCVDCHGIAGKGDGLKSRNLVDGKGRSILPRDFTLGKFKSGSSDREIMRAFMLGLDGTPMASFESSLPGARAGYLLNYLRSFEEKEWFAKLFLQPVR